MFLGDKIRETRLARELTQEELARLSSTTVSTIRRIELRRVNPHPATLSRISVALGVTPDFFVPWTSDRPAWRTRQERKRRRMLREGAGASA